MTPSPLSLTRGGASFLTLKTCQDGGKGGEVAATREQEAATGERAGGDLGTAMDTTTNDKQHAGSLKGNFSASVSLSLEIIRRG